jgi:tetratricopeptide (TPR) repeat protein
MTAQIQDTSRRIVAQAEVSGDGRFDFRGVPLGDYYLVVDNGMGVTISQTPISIMPGMRTTELRVSMPKQEQPPSGPVSVAELQDPPSREAIRAAAAAGKETAAGHYDKAVALLEKAIAISPGFGMAYTNLTAAYVRAGKLDEAIATAQKAVELGAARANGKPGAADLSNLAYAQLLRRRFAEAVVNSRHALQIEPDSDKAHLILGAAMASMGSDLHEAEQHLALAAKTLASARPILEAVQRKLASETVETAQTAQR